jgi:hypothetical protein
MRSEATVLEQQPVPDEAVKAAQAIMLDGVERDVERVRRKIDTRAAVEAAAPFIRAQVIRELRDAASDQGPQSAYWLAADYLERK